jgi:hypothetical protein
MKRKHWLITTRQEEWEGGMGVHVHYATCGWDGSILDYHRRHPEREILFAIDVTEEVTE